MTEDIEHALSAFVEPFVSSPVWGAKQGYGSFLTLEFGQPELIVKERFSAKRGKWRSAHVRGTWSIWIYCCEWRLSMQDKEVAWSEDSRDDIARAMGMLDGQILTRVVADAASGTSRFDFDLGSTLETWPTGDDPTEEQWFIYAPDKVFAYRADGRWMRQPPNVSREEERWA